MSNMESKVSIVVATYNRADFLFKSIDSLINQTYKNYEIIIVDDGSSDRTEDLVKTKYCNFHSTYKI